MYERIFLKESKTLAIIVGESFYEYENTRALVCETREAPYFQPVVGPYSILSAGELWLRGDTVVTKKHKATIEDITYNEVSKQIVLRLRVSEEDMKDWYKLVTEDQVELIIEDLSDFMKSGAIVYNRKLKKFGIVDAIVKESYHKTVKVKDVMEINTHLRREDGANEVWDVGDLKIYSIQDAKVFGYINFGL